MTISKLKLVLNPTTDNYVYQIYPIQQISDTVEKPSASISVPGKSYKQNIYMGVQGQQSDLRIDFKLWNDGNDRAYEPSSDTHTAPSAFSDTDGDGNSDVVTVEEQIRYLKEYVQDPGFDATWKIESIQNAYYENTEVYFERLETNPIDVNNPRFKDAVIFLNFGEGVG